MRWFPRLGIWISTLSLITFLDRGGSPGNLPEAPIVPTRQDISVSCAVCRSIVCLLSGIVASSGVVGSGKRWSSAMAKSALRKNSSSGNALLKGIPGRTPLPGEPNAPLRKRSSSEYPVRRVLPEELFFREPVMCSSGDPWGASFNPI